MVKQQFAVKKKKKDKKRMVKYENKPSTVKMTFQTRYSAVICIFGTWSYLKEDVICLAQTGYSSKKACTT